MPKTPASRRKPAALALELFGRFNDEAPDEAAAGAGGRENGAELEEGVRLEDVAPRRREARRPILGTSGGDTGGRSVPVAVLELRALAVEAYLAMPLGSALRFEADGLPFVASTSKAAHGRALEEGVPAFAGGELRALALAAKNDRLWGDELRDELERKRRRPRHRTTPAAVLGALAIEKCDALEGYTFRELEERLAVELVAVEVG